MKYADKAGIKSDTIDGLKGKLKGDISNKVNKSISKVGNKLFEPVVVQAEKLVPEQVYKAVPVK